MERADKRKIKNEDTGEEPEEKKAKIKDEIISEDSDNTSQQEKPTRAKRAAKKPVKIQIISDSDEADFNLTSDNSDEDFQPKKARIKKKPKPKVKKEPKQRAPRKPKEQASKKEPKVPKEKAPKKDPKEKVPKEPKAKAPKKESTKIKAPVTNAAIKNEFVWHEIDRLAEKENLDYRVAKALIKLFEAGDTIPFIARYRKALTHNMPPEKLRDVKESYEEICACKRKADNIMTVIKKSGHFTPDINDAILKCKNAEELEYVYAPFKTGPKRTLVQRAKQLGLEESALAILSQTKTVNIDSLINPKREGLKNREDVEKGLVHIIAHVITSETETLEFIRKLRSELRMTVESKKVTKEVKSESEKKFQIYFDFKILLQHIKPHQTLALNRGENLQILSVKINVPDYALHQFTNFCYQKYGEWGNQERVNLLKNSIEDAYKRKVHPLIVRQTRAELNVKAEKASVEIFALNLKKLLLVTPLKGKAIMGIDPGFKLGCKVAVISPNGDLLDTSVIYPHSAKNQKDHAIIKELLHKYNCSLIALGNGTACRETETWLSDLIKFKYFAPLDVSYTIVDECGASIYSCSAEAKKEFKELDPLLISATSLARRVQDPLAEMVKVDPQHLGVGMYQHDVNKKLLENTLNEIVSECVSFVGVDLNTASQCLLRRVAGLTDLRATNIIKHRMLHGGFTNRWQIKDVKGIGEKVFEQCAGFLRVAPSDSSDAETFFQRPDTNPLDCTWIHPESYELTEKILEKFGLQLNQVGQPSFITSLCKCLVLNSPNSLAKEFDSTKATVKLILDTLRKPFDYDLRNEDNHQPIFRKEVKTLYDICVDMVLTGQVRNVTSFGAFVDIGVGFHGLIHQSEMRGLNVQFGDKVEVRVLKVEIDRHRIGLTLLNVL